VVVACSSGRSTWSTRVAGWSPRPRSASRTSRASEGSVNPETTSRIEEILGAVDADLAAGFPGDRAEPQPVHTVYVSAADVEVDTPAQWGRRALELAADVRPVLPDLAGEEALAVALSRLRTNPIE